MEYERGCEINEKKKKKKECTVIKGKAQQIIEWLGCNLLLTLGRYSSDANYQSISNDHLKHHLKFPMPFFTIN